MKTSKCLFIVLMIGLLSATTFAQSGLQKTLISTVLQGESNMVFFDLPGEVAVEVWDRNYIKVEIDVTTNLENENVFEYLKESGRYDIEKSFNTYYFLELNLSNIREEVRVNHIVLEETFKFKITVPWDIDIEAGKNNDMTANYDFETAEGNILLTKQIKE